MLKQLGTLYMYTKQITDYPPPPPPQKKKGYYCFCINCLSFCITPPPFFIICVPPHPQAGELSLPSTISVYSANSVARHDLNSGDKIILSPYILLACEHREIAYPMVSYGSGGRMGRRRPERRRGGGYLLGGNVIRRRHATCTCKAVAEWIRLHHLNTCALYMYMYSTFTCIHYTVAKGYAHGVFCMAHVCSFAHHAHCTLCSLLSWKTRLLEHACMQGCWISPPLWQSKPTFHSG